MNMGIKSLLGIICPTNLDREDKSLEAFRITGFYLTDIYFGRNILFIFPPPLSG